MIFKQNPKDGSCEIIFSEEEIKIIKENKKIYFPAETLKKFGDVMYRMVWDWHNHFSEKIKLQPSHEFMKIEGEKPKSD
jgi:hypothetical protein